MGWTVAMVEVVVGGIGVGEIAGVVSVVCVSDETGVGVSEDNGGVSVALFSLEVPDGVRVTVCVPAGVFSGDCVVLFGVGVSDAVSAAGLLS